MGAVESVMGHIANIVSLGVMSGLFGRMLYELRQKRSALATCTAQDHADIIASVFQEFTSGNIKVVRRGDGESTGRAAGANCER